MDSPSMASERVKLLDLPASFQRSAHNGVLSKGGIIERAIYSLGGDQAYFVGRKERDFGLEEALHFDALPICNSVIR
jgi:hypothetical protein